MGRGWSTLKHEQKPSPLQFLTHPFVFIMAGLLIMAAAGFLFFGGSSDNRDSDRAMDQARRVVAELKGEVDTVRAMLERTEIQAKAIEVLQDQDSQQNLDLVVRDLIRHVSDIKVFGPELLLGDFSSLGENQFIQLEMIIQANRDRFSPLQALPVGDGYVLAIAASLGEKESPQGFMVLFLDSEGFLEKVKTSIPMAGYLALEHRVGGFPNFNIAEYGGRVPAGFQPVRLAIADTMLQVVVPQAVAVSDGGSMRRLLTFLLGCLFLAYGVVKRRKTTVKNDDFEAIPQSQVMRKPIAESAQEEEVPALPELEPDTAVEEEPAIALEDLHHEFEMRHVPMEHHGGSVELTSDIFRAYDIRGIVGKSLDSGVAFKIGQAVGSAVQDADAGPLMVGRDGRFSGPELVDGLIDGVLSTGCNAIDLGTVPTGALYYAANELGKGTGVMVTGSHNPPDYNGFKIMIGGKTLSGDDITDLYRRIADNDLRQGTGSVQGEEVLDRYCDRIASDIQLQRPLKVVADSGNGIGGICSTQILRAIGADVIPLFEEVDGSFPNHHPDPSEPHNLEDLIATVKSTGADLGVAFDGDADRLGVVTSDGSIVFADRIMMLYAREVLSRNPGANIIYDVKCTGHLDSVIAEAGGVPEMYKTGHSLIKNRMKEVDAPFAGEMSGHFFFKDRWYGFDCGIYSACRLLEILAMDERTPLEVLSALPNSVSTPELKIYMNEGENHAFIEEFQAKARFEDARLSTIDGVRADFPDGWGLVRASNTTPILVLRFDADSEESLQRIQDLFAEQLRALNPDIELPF